MNDGGSRLPFNLLPCLFPENPLNFLFGRKRVKERLYEPQAGSARVIDKFKGSKVHPVSLHLAITHDPVAGKLEPIEPESLDAHRQN